MHAINGMILGLVILVPASAVAQQKVDDRYPFKPGDIVSFGPNAYPEGATYRIANCDPIDKPYRECRMVRRAPMAEDHERPFVMNNYIGKLEVVGHEDAPGVRPAIANPTLQGQPRTVAGTPVPPTTPTAATGICPKSPYGGPVSGTRPASAALFQQKITDSITMGAYGPFWYGVRLANVQLGAAIVNRVSVQPGVGATRANNGAPPNAKMYPVSTTMSVCDGAPTSSSSWRTSNKKFLCFVSASNEWTCGASN